MKRCILTILMIGFTLPALASTAWVAGTKVTRTMVQEDAFGSCMVKLDKAIAGSGLNCYGNWVTFSCDGTFNKRDVANKMFDAAQMALALEMRVSVLVNDLKKHNGICLAERIDVFK